MPLISDSGQDCHISSLITWFKWFQYDISNISIAQITYPYISSINSNTIDKHIYCTNHISTSFTTSMSITHNHFNLASYNSNIHSNLTHNNQSHKICKIKSVIYTHLIITDNLVEHLFLLHGLWFDSWCSLLIQEVRSNLFGLLFCFLITILVHRNCIYTSYCRKWALIYLSRLNFLLQNQWWKVAYWYHYTHTHI